MPPKPDHKAARHSCPMSRINAMFDEDTWLADLGLESVQTELDGLGVRRATDLCFLEPEDVADIRAAWQRRLILTSRDYVARLLREEAAQQEFQWEDAQRKRLLETFQAQVQDTRAFVLKMRNAAANNNGGGGDAPLPGDDLFDDAFFASFLHNEHVTFAKRCKMPPPAFRPSTGAPAPAAEFGFGGPRPAGAAFAFGGPAASSPAASGTAPASRAFGGGGPSTSSFGGAAAAGGGFGAARPAAGGFGSSPPAAAPAAAKSKGPEPPAAAKAPSAAGFGAKTNGGFGSGFGKAPAATSGWGKAPSPASPQSQSAFGKAPASDSEFPPFTGKP